MYTVLTTKNHSHKQNVFLELDLYRRTHKSIWCIASVNLFNDIPPFTNPIFYQPTFYLDFKSLVIFIES
jgi:hypothetical protein